MFKVGDKVRIRKDLDAGLCYGGCYVTLDMMQHVGKEDTIASITKDIGYGKRYKLSCDNRRNWSDGMLEKVETGIPTLAVLEYLETKQRMCKTYGDNCVGCCMARESRECDLGIIPERAIEIVRKWGEEHPAKTYLSDFLEKYPHAELCGWDEIPTFCPCDLGYFEKNDCDKNCVRCWNQEMGVDYDLAIQSMMEKSGRENGCDYCNSEQINNTVAYIPNDTQNQDGLEIIFKYCPMCGRKLVGE